jgi:hypothetical protein
MELSFSKMAWELSCVCWRGKHGVPWLSTERFAPAEYPAKAGRDWTDDFSNLQDLQER